jgi:uncharacterized membrane-anchored protein
MKPTLAAMIVFLGAAATAQAKPKAKAAAAATTDQTPPPEEGYKPLVGPQTIELGHDLVIELPASYLYLDPPQAKKLMEKNGNFWNDNLLGVIGKTDADWLVTVRYTEDGYVKDDEAAKLDADAILGEIREGTEEANKERENRGFKALHVGGWSDPPRYERERHHMIWGIRAKTDDDPEDSVNFNTRILGRKGFVALNLMDSVQRIEASKPEAAILLAATHYKTGARYEDFNQKTDKVAEYGLAALVLGGAGLGALKLVKIGLLAKFSAKILALLIAFKKIIIVALLGVAAFVRRLWAGRKARTEAASAGSAAEQPAAEGGPGGQPGT